MHITLLSRHEHRPAVDARRAECNRSRKSTSVADPARSDVGRLELSGGESEEQEASDVVFARVAGAFEAVDAEHVCRTQRM